MASSTTTSIAANGDANEHARHRRQQRLMVGRSESSASSESESYEASRDSTRQPLLAQDSEVFQVDVVDDDDDDDDAESTGKAKTIMPGLTRQDSLPLRLQRTDKAGRYSLKATDPIVRDVLKQAVAQQLQQQTSPSVTPVKRHAFKDILFSRQFTQFDRQNPSNTESPFFGFFTLFWLAMTLMLGRVATQNYRNYGSILGGNEVLKLMFSKDIIVLGLTDGVMCVSTAFGLGLQIVVMKGWLNWNRSGWIIQNLWQTFYLMAVIGWTFYREWPWTHTIFVVLHALVFLMKQHSHAFYNGYLSELYKRKKILVATLDELKSRQPADSPISSPKLSQVLGGEDPFSSSSSGGVRSRRPLPRRTSTLATEKSQVASVAKAITESQPLDAAQMRAFAEVLSGEIDLIDGELRGKCSSTRNYYPANLNAVDFFQWTCFPTLVYELEYPRQERRDWWYIAEKGGATFGVLCLMQVVSQAYIYPAVVEAVTMKEQGLTLAQRWENLPFIVSDMLFPMLLEQLLTWYVIWECVLNVLAELTRFADRGFYAAWWNSTSWDQYARDWNRPVHNFLLRHVYHSSISAFHLKKKEAMFATFFLSALVHELLMFCLFKKVRGYLFCMQLLQLPMAAFSRTKIMKGRKVLGNVIFWFGLFIGPAFLTSLYLVV